jgi:hypothetical protein
MPTPVFFFENVGLPFSGLDCVEYWEFSKISTSLAVSNFVRGCYNISANLEVFIFWTYDFGNRAVNCCWPSPAQLFLVSGPVGTHGQTFVRSKPLMCLEIGPPLRREEGLVFLWLALSKTEQ